MPGLEGDQPEIKPLAFSENWKTAGRMFQNYAGVDTAFERTASGLLRKPFLRWVGFPFYFNFFNDGYLLKVNYQPAGVIFLQYRQMVAHINDIEINKPFQGKGYSHRLLDFAEKKAREHRKRFITLVVTLTNSRALTLYRKSGFLDQHHCYFFLSRLPEIRNIGKSNSGEGPGNHLFLTRLTGQKARKNLEKFFLLETHLAEPLTGEVWQACYFPAIPRPGEGTSYGIYLPGNPESLDHADFYFWGASGRWRIYLAPDYWGSPEEAALFQLFTRLTLDKNLNGPGIMLGTAAHHQKVSGLARNQGFVERDRERMLMIKPL